MLTFYQEVLSETIFRGHHTSKIDSSLLMRSNASPLASEEALRFFLTCILKVSFGLWE